VDLLGTNISVQCIQVNLTEISYIGTLFIVWFIQELFYPGFGVDTDRFLCSTKKYQHVVNKTQYMDVYLDDNDDETLPVLSQ
jgi:hypothetical protein